MPSRNVLRTENFESIIYIVKQILKSVFDDLIVFSLFLIWSFFRTWIVPCDFFFLINQALKCTANRKIPNHNKYYYDEKNDWACLNRKSKKKISSRLAQFCFICVVNKERYKAPFFNGNFLSISSMFSLDISTLWWWLK